MTIHIKNYNVSKYLIETCICQEVIGAENGKIALVIKSGLINEKRQCGIAHLTEHMLLSFEYENKYHSYFPYLFKAITSIDKTVFEFTCLPGDIFKIIKIIRQILTGQTLYESYLNDIKVDVISEYVKVSKDYLYRINELLLKKYKIAKTMPIGIPKTIYKITYAMIYRYFIENYRSSNSGLVVCGNIDYDRIEEYVNQLLTTSYDNNVVMKKKKYMDSKKRLWGRRKIVLENSIKNDSAELHVFSKIEVTRKCYEIVVDNIVFTILEEELGNKSNKTKIELNRFSKHNMFLHLTIANPQISYKSFLNKLKELECYIKKRDTNIINWLREIIDKYCALSLQQKIRLNDRFDQLIDLYLYGDIYYTEEDYRNILKEIRTGDVLKSLEKWIKQLANTRKCVVFELRG